MSAVQIGIENYVVNRVSRKYKRELRADSTTETRRKVIEMRIKFHHLKHYIDIVLADYIQHEASDSYKQKLYIIYKERMLDLLTWIMKHTDITVDQCFIRNTIAAFHPIIDFLSNGWIEFYQNGFQFTSEHIHTYRDYFNELLSIIPIQTKPFLPDYLVHEISNEQRSIGNKLVYTVNLNSPTNGYNILAPYFTEDRVNVIAGWFTKKMIVYNQPIDRYTGLKNRIINNRLHSHNRRSRRIRKAPKYLAYNVKRKTLTPCQNKYPERGVEWEQKVLADSNERDYTTNN